MALFRNTYFMNMVRAATIQPSTRVPITQVSIQARSMCTQTPAKVPITLIQELRAKTGAGVADCKNALVASNSDIAAATTWLRNKGKLTATKLSGRVAAEGVVTFAAKGNKGVILEVNSETDFVSRSDYFRNLAQRIAHTSLASEKVPQGKFGEVPIDDVNKLHVEVETEEDDGKKTSSKVTVSDAVTLIVGKVKENIKVRRVHGISIDNGVVGGYLHSTEGDARAGKTGAIVVLETSNPSNNEELATIATQLATHVVGLKPEYIGKEEVPKSVIKERIAASKNPTKTQHHHILEDIALLEQRYFLGDGNETVREHLNKEAKRLGLDKIKVHSFTRLVVGEGIEKKEEDFAKQVADQLKK